MKKTFLALGIAISFLMACGGSNTDDSAAPQTTAADAAPAVTKPAMEPGELLIVKSDCIGCHNKENKIIGPSYVAIAAKYPNTAENISYLAGKIVNGGKGVWGNIPMTPHPKVSTADAEEMVRYILSLKK